MFIKLGEYVISASIIKYIHRYPSGVHVYLKGELDPIKIMNVDDEDYQNAIYILMND